MYVYKIYLNIYLNKLFWVSEIFFQVSIYLSVSKDLLILFSQWNQPKTDLFGKYWVCPINFKILHIFRDDEYNIRKIDNKFIITKKQKSYPSSVVSGSSVHSSGRPKSGVRSHYSCHQSQLNSSEEDIYEHSSTEIGPYITQRNTWLDPGIERSVSDISTQTIQNRGK